MSALPFPVEAANDPERLLEALLPDIVHAVRAACHHYSAGPNGVEDFCHDIVLLLMEDNYRRLCSFRLESSKKTWITTIVRHHVSDYVSRQKKAMSLEDISPELFTCNPPQETEVIAEERGRELGEAVSRLTACEQRLIELLCRDDLTQTDIAMEMGIKVDSVRRRKHALIKKLRGIVDASLSMRRTARKK